MSDDGPKYKIRESSKVLWEVRIPSNGQFCISYTKNINVWQRMWMRFMGWTVTKPEKDYYIY